MNTHTPGPWAYRPRQYDDWGVVRASDGGLVASVRSGRFPPMTEAEEDEFRRANRDPFEANARLIAAAPDMLAALRALTHADNAPLVLSDAHSLKLMDDVRAAIAIAEGRPITKGKGT